MICSICNNQNIDYFASNGKKIYCRRCIRFKGKTVEYRNILNEPILNLNYELSLKQKEVSAQIARAREEHKNAFVYAVTGAGKTELVYKAIFETLKERKKVGFVVPRKDVVIDLYPRIKDAFKNNKVISVYGGHTKDLDGDITILTTHQLYRYKNYFDYLVFDEIDAFPYVDNQVLNAFFLKSIRGNYVMMSATPSREKIKMIKNQGGVYLELLRRYHNYDLPVPKIKLFFITPLFYLIKLLFKFKKEHKQCFVFAPTIKEAEDLYKIVRLVFKQSKVVHSKVKARNEIIKKFKNGEYDFLITTSILERGVTVKNLQVIIYHCDHELYDSSSLIQIAGRVGRKIGYEVGDVYLLGYKKTNSMDLAIKQIERANAWKPV